MGLGWSDISMKASMKFMESGFLKALKALCYPDNLTLVQIGQSAL